MKTTYYTKCGKVAFEKNSTSVVTRFEDVNEHCGQCPFIQHTNTTRKGEEVHITYCQAGSKKPNHKTEYHTCSENDSTTLDIISLDWELLKEIYEYATSVAGCTATAESFKNAFHATDKADCRKSLPIYFENNKKGKAAKKTIIDKYFKKTESDPEITCKECKSFIPDKAFSKIGKCEAKHSIVEIIQADKCGKFEPIREEVKEVNCKKDKCSFNNGEGACGFDDNDANNAMFAQLAQEAIKLGCKNAKLKKAFHDQPCIIQDAPEDKFKEESVDTSNFDSEHVEQNIPDTINEVSNNVQTFDYSSVDNDTAAFLQDKANRITEIRIKSVIAIGKELKEAQEKLANNKTGTFQSWVESLGITPKTAYNYINGFDYIVKNFHNIEDAQNIQPSLLFAISKPSSPVELQEKVLDGTVKTHKEYKELEAQLKAANELAETYKANWENERSENDELEDKLYQKKEKIDKYIKEVELLKSQLSEAKASGNDEEVHMLREELEEAEKKISDLEQQLKDTPIEVPAVQEVIPDHVQQELQQLRNNNQKNADYNLVSNLMAGFNALHFGQLQNYAVVLRSNNSRMGIDRVKEMIKDFRMKIESLDDYLDEESDPSLNYLEDTDQISIDNYGHSFCSMCQHTDPDQVSDEDLDNNKVYCLISCTSVGMDDKACSNFEQINF
ncbi:hypothetical protein [Pseudobacteroides cellulosolvens]|uniref:Uncharacterized protein n=1 Tax=Pseudobacteroides cellulosolvens ATCC 35603 = DSM 2933 TaxID=398512 RepID=A0A0L6JG36_9FIRM|nr:hypothetical protein [Pseudobacteroides cellulosolvens]KNY24816.1 hypothetical protein Bccel_0073 [Pseudobacteroides cellulosolvens ATCC 35603 = DSM 2933]